MKLTKGMLKRIIAEEMAADVDCDSLRDQIRQLDPYDPEQNAIGRDLQAKLAKCPPSADTSTRAGRNRFGDLEEGIENITPENIGIAIDAIMKMKYLLLPILGTAGVAALMEFLQSKQSGESSDDSMLNRDI